MCFYVHMYNIFLTLTIVHCSLSLSLTHEKGLIMTQKQRLIDMYLPDWNVDINLLSSSSMLIDEDHLRLVILGLRGLGKCECADG